MDKEIKLLLKISITLIVIIGLISWGYLRNIDNNVLKYCYEGITNFLK